jgi:hypothetical protein
MSIETTEAGPVALNHWLEQKGVTPMTAWRWRKKGWLETINISGRVYITPEAIAKFTRRAASGEFAKDHPAPKRAA